MAFAMEEAALPRRGRSSDHPHAVRGKTQDAFTEILFERCPDASTVAR